MIDDIYLAEAKRRLDGSWHPVKVLAEALQELKWQPPIDPDEVATHLLYASLYPNNDGFERRMWSGTFKIMLAAYKAGKAAA